MNVKKLIGVGYVILMTLVLVACGTNDQGTNESAADDRETDVGELVYRTIVEQEVTSVDMALNTDVFGALILNNVYEGLYRLDAESMPQPAGASEFATVSDDGLIYTFKLREEAVWSNGDPVTAADYVYGWQRVADPATEAENAYLHGVVKNGEAITAGEMDKSELGIEALSDYELKVTLERAVPYFDRLLTFATFFPQHQSTIEEFGKDFAATSENAVYNGPFILAEFDGPGSDTDWEYVKNETYWDRETVKLDKITATVVKESSTALNLYQDNQADEVRLTGELAQQMASHPDFVIDKQAATYFFQLNLSDEDSVFRNLNLRKAISYSIDRETLTSEILTDGSIASTGLVPADMSQDPASGQDFAQLSGELVSFDEAEATKAWEAAKEELGIDSLEIEILSSDSDFSKKNVEFAQGSLEKLEGLTIKVAPVPLSIRIERSNQGEFDIVLGGWSATYADPSTFLDLFATDSSYNRGKYSNAAYDDLLREASTVNATNLEARFQNYLAAEKLLLDDLGVIPIYQTAEARLRRQNFDNIVTHTAGASFEYKWIVKTGK